MATTKRRLSETKHELEAPAKFARRTLYDFMANNVGEQLASSRGVRSTSGVFVERLRRGFTAVRLYTRGMALQILYGTTNDVTVDTAFVADDVLRTPMRYSGELRDQLYAVANRYREVVKDFNMLVGTHRVHNRNGYIVPSVFLHPPPRPPCPALQPELCFVFDGRDVLEASASHHAHHYQLYFASVLGDSTTPTVLKGTAINAHAAAMSQLLAYHEARRYAGPSPRFCKPRLFAAWLHSAFGDVLNDDVIDRIRSYLRRLPREQAPDQRTWTEACVLATGMHFSRVDTHTYERVVSESDKLPISASAYWWHRVLTDPWPRPSFGHVARLGGAAPKHLRLAARIVRSPVTYGFGGYLVKTARSIADVLCALNNASETLIYTNLPVCSTPLQRAKYQKRLVYVASVILAYCAVQRHLASYYQSDSFRPTIISPSDVARCVHTVLLHQDEKRAEVRDRLIDALGRSRCTDLYSGRPRANFDGSLPKFPVLAGSGQIITAARVMRDESMLKAVLENLDSSCLIEMPQWPHPTQRTFCYTTEYAYMESLIVSPRWKAVDCRACFNCLSRIEGVSTSACVCPAYVPVATAAPSERVNDCSTTRAVALSKRIRDASHGSRRLHKAEHGMRCKQLMPCCAALVCSVGHDQVVAPIDYFRDIYCLRSASGINSAPHNHFIDGGLFTPHLLEDEGHWLERAAAVGFHLPISQLLPGSFRGYELFVGGQPEPRAASDECTALRSRSDCRAYALQTIGAVLSTDPRELLINRINAYKLVLSEMLQATRYMRKFLDCDLRDDAMTAHSEDEVVDGLYAPGAYPYQCRTDAKRKRQCRELGVRRSRFIHYVSACRPYPTALAPFGTLAHDFGLPVRIADSACPHVYQLRVHKSSENGTYGRGSVYTITPYDHTEERRTVFIRGADLRYTVQRHVVRGLNPVAFDRPSTADRSLKYHMTAGDLSNHIGAEREWCTESDISRAAEAAIFEPDPDHHLRRHQWEALAFSVTCKDVYVKWPLNEQQSPPFFYDDDETEIDVV
jgi:hypothetical protein